MRCRWMLYLEADDNLLIMPGVPRSWLKDGDDITLRDAASYFGHVSFSVASQISTGYMNVYVKLDRKTHPLPDKLIVRIPHPDGMKPKSVTAGAYEIIDETVVINGFMGEIEFKAFF